MGKFAVFIEKSSCMQIELTDLNYVSKNCTSKLIAYTILLLKSSK